MYSNIHLKSSETVPLKGLSGEMILLLSVKIMQNMGPVGHRYDLVAAVLRFKHFLGLSSNPSSVVQGNRKKSFCAAQSVENTFRYHAQARLMFGTLFHFPYYRIHIKIMLNNNHAFVHKKTFICTPTVCSIFITKETNCHVGGNHR